jgi:hypothetical protein
MPQTMRKSQILLRAQNVTMPPIPQRGITSVGSAAISSISRFR